MIDTKNILRLDIEKIYHQTEQRSVDIAESVDPTGQSHDVIVICGADYPTLHDFLILGTSEIADRGTYVKCDNQTGLDAITAHCPPEFCCSPKAGDCCDDDSLSRQPQGKKLLGEMMDPNPVNQVIFNVPELAHVDLIRRTVVQSYIHEAIIAFLLYKWYQLKAKGDLMNLYRQEFEERVDNVRNNSVTNIKRKNFRRSYNVY
jgi:hypothetical protein